MHRASIPVVGVFSRRFSSSSALSRRASDDRQSRRSASASCKMSRRWRLAHTSPVGGPASVLFQNLEGCAGVELCEEKASLLPFVMLLDELKLLKIVGQPCRFCRDTNLPLENHPRPYRNAAEQIHDVFIVHADAARRHETSNRAGIVGPVDGEFIVG
jgi:hypothetical protein